MLDCAAGAVRLLSSSRAPGPAKYPTPAPPTIPARRPCPLRRRNGRLPRSSGVLLHPTSLPGGRLGDGGVPLRRLARRGGAVVVADAAARPAGPHRLALQGALGVRGLAGPARRAGRAGVEAEELDFREREAYWIGGLGAASRRAARSPTRCASSASGSALRAYAAERGVRLHRRRADLRRAGQRRPPRRTPSSSATGVVAGVPPDAFTDDGPAVGQPALRLAGAAAARLPLVGRAAPAHVRARRPRADRPLPRLRRLLGGARGRARRARRALAARPRARARSTPPGASSATLPLIAEDLGVITPAVERLRDVARPARDGWCCSSAFEPDEPDSAVPLRAPRGAARRLHRHARQRHGARLVRVARSARDSRWSSAELARRGIDERRALVVADPARVRLAARAWRWCRCRTCSASAARRA